MRLRKYVHKYRRARYERKIEKYAHKLETISDQPNEGGQQRQITASKRHSISSNGSTNPAERLSQLFEDTSGLDTPDLDCPWADMATIRTTKTVASRKATPIDGQSSAHDESMCAERRVTSLMHLFRSSRQAPENSD